MSSRTPPHLVTLILLTAFSPLSLNMFLPSLGHMAQEFETDYALMSVAVAGYLAVTAAIQLIAGPLADRYGRRPVLLVTLSLFCLAPMLTPDRGCVTSPPMSVSKMSEFKPCS